MTEMPNKEALNFKNNEGSVASSRIEGTSALKLDEDFTSEPVGDESEGGDKKEIEEVRHSITKNILPMSDIGVEAGKAPRGVVGPVGKQGREASGGDRTGGEKKKGRGLRVATGVLAGMVAAGGIGYGVFKDQINSLFGIGGGGNEGGTPLSSVTVKGEMPSQSENIESPAPTAAATETPSPSQETTETPVSTDNAEETDPTATPATGKTEAAPGILKGADRKEAEVNQRFEDFLNGTGEYTEEKIKNEGFISNYVHTSDLGCLVANGEICDVQGILLAYEKVDNGEVFALGIKDKNGERIITLVEFPSQLYINHDLTLDFPIYPDRFWNSAAHIRSFGYSRTSDYYNFLNSYIGELSLIGIDVCLSSNTSYYNEWPDGYKEVYAEFIDLKIPVNRSLMTDINFVDDSNHSFVKNIESAKEFYNSKPEYIMEVTNFDEFKSLIDNNYNQIPCVEGFGFMSLD